MLKRKFRVSTSNEYKHLYNSGKKISGKYIIVYILGNSLGYCRFGIVTSKKTGKAVIRNRVKRQLRSIIERNIDNLQGSYDIAVIGRYNISEAEFQLLFDDFKQVMRKAGIWVKK